MAESDLFPRLFGEHLLLASLGRGGMGEAFLARDSHGDGELCLLKTLRAARAVDARVLEEGRRRFRSEAALGLRLSHPHIRGVLGFGTVDDEEYVVLEYVRGVTLRDLGPALAHMRKGPASAAILRIGAELLDALQHAHEKGVVHQDVSPHNVLIDLDGDVKLIDFGLARASDVDAPGALVMGKVGYMAPEQARGEVVDGKADQLAAAIVLYEALAGDRFYGGMSTHQAWQIVGAGGHRPRRWHALDPEVAPLLAPALSPVPADRYESCAAFASALEELRLRRFPFAPKAELKLAVASVRLPEAAAGDVWEGPSQSGGPLAS
jgi:serine/threonine-protein kinase